MDLLNQLGRAARQALANQRAADFAVAKQGIAASAHAIAALKDSLETEQRELIRQASAGIEQVSDKELVATRRRILDVRANLKVAVASGAALKLGNPAAADDVARRSFRGHLF
ncbi:hypothetical protein [Methylibium sp.]|uniref:hypothetical protein n=1 Tax=Methylibium sp. TaxID=2067992 RepID=UPI001809C5DB|nr:hypothetical protein [Methylibium sp.]MBA3590295.1 hypothetical protein [Methylibium sp.]